MPQPVKLSDSLILHARLAGESQQRSIAGQVEFWASLGKSIELLLNGKQVQALRDAETAQKLARAIATVETEEGRARVAAVIAQRPYPHFKQVAGRADLLVRMDEDGSETIGRFVNRMFVPEKAQKMPKRTDRPKNVARRRVLNSPSVGISRARAAARGR